MQIRFDFKAPWGPFQKESQFRLDLYRGWDLIDHVSSNGPILEGVLRRCNRHGAWVDPRSASLLTNSMSDWWYMAEPFRQSLPNPTLVPSGDAEYDAECGEALAAYFRDREEKTRVWALARAEAEARAAELFKPLSRNPSLEEEYATLLAQRRARFEAWKRDYRISTRALARCVNGSFHKIRREICDVGESQGFPMVWDCGKYSVKDSSYGVDATISSLLMTKPGNPRQWRNAASEVLQGRATMRKERWQRRQQHP